MPKVVMFASIDELVKCELTRFGKSSIGRSNTAVLKELKRGGCETKEESRLRWIFFVARGEV